MFSRSFFSTRLKLLRKSYFLTNNCLAFLLNLKNEASIRDYEAQRTVPSVDVLSDIANLFGVSIDWLTGRSNVPYTDEILLSLEEYNLLPTVENYETPSKRSKLYSLPVRANIIFIFKLLHSAPPIASISNMSTLSNTSPEHAKRTIFLSYIHLFKRKTSMSYDKALVKLIKQEITDPLFDITTQPIKE